MIHWHYTTGSRMSFILTGPALEPLAPARRLKFEKRPILWFTKAPSWDLAASAVIEDLDVSPGSDAPMIRMTPAQMCDRFAGIYRIGVDDGEVPLLRWPELGRAAGMT